MPRAGFEPAIPIFERPKTVLASNRAVIETGTIKSRYRYLQVQGNCIFFSQKKIQDV
jgi:hypothetical protein